MDPQSWLNELEKELQQRRLPRRYVMRLMRELSDHVMDELEKPMSKEDQQSADLRERLGTPQGMAESAKQEYHSLTFAVRHPVWTFGVFPPFLFLILAIGIYIVSASLVESVFNLSSLATQENTKWTEVLAQGFFIGCIVVASLVVTVVFAKIARKYALKRQWPMTAAVVVALVCGCLWTEVTSKTPEQRGRVTIGVSGPIKPAKLSLQQIFQCAVPLVVAVWMTRSRSAMDDPAKQLSNAA